MSRLLLSSLAIFALCACNPGQNGGRRQIPPDRPVWNAVVEDGRIHLAFGPPGGEQVALTLACEPHSGRLTVSGPLEPGSSKLVLASGGHVELVAGAAEADPEAGAKVLSGGARACDPAFAAFARTGRLTRVDPSGRIELTAAGAELRLVRDFLDRCAR
jgi:hypothetical protein